MKRAFSLFSAALVIGAGLVVGPAAQADSSNPSPVTNINVSMNGTTAQVSWSPPAFTGNDWRGDPSPIRNYTVYAWSTIGSSPYGSMRSCDTSSTSCTLFGLTAGASYYIEITARNAWVGRSTARSGDFTVCCAIPSAPRSISAVHGNASARITWTPPSSLGGSAVVYTVSIAGGPVVCTTGDLSCNVTGLVNGQSYSFNVYATNSAGSSPRTTSNSITPRGPAGPPLGVSASPAIKSAEVFWSPPTNNGGAAIRQYVAVASPGGQFCAVAAAARSCVVPNLLDGTEYTFVVHADNSEGRGAPSAPTAAVRTASTPASPTQVQAEVARGRGVVEWFPPEDNGGTEITEYVVVAEPGGAACTTEALTCTVVGLSNGVTYSFNVTAINGVGPGPASAPSSPVRLLAVPTAPQQVRVNLRGTTAQIRWRPPRSTGGQPIRGYTVTASAGGSSCRANARTMRCTITGLPMARTVTFVVSAHTARGKGAGAVSNTVRTPNPPVIQAPASRQDAEPDKPEQSIS